VLGSGPTKSSVLLLNGLQVDLRVLPSDRWGTLLSYFTGSKNHNVRLRELALKLGYTLNEHAFTALEGGDEIRCSSEDELYELLGLPFIPAVLREDRGEIEAAIKSNLPELVTSHNIISDLHMHSTWSDGKLTILEMARAALDRGFQHIVISDHSASLGIANGLSQDRLRSQADEIAEVNQMFGPDFRILHGTEMEIRADGNLDYPDDVRLDPGGTIPRGHKARMYSKIHDVETPSVDLTVYISYKHQLSSTWVMETATYNPTWGFWYYEWNIPPEAETGLYDVKVEAYDQDGEYVSEIENGEYEVVNFV